MLHVIREAVSDYNDRDNWQKLVKKVLKCDFSWQHSAVDYEKLYISMIK